MPVTRSRTYLSDIGLEDSNNTTGFLFGDEDSNSGENRTTPTNNNPDSFPALLRQQGYGNLVSFPASTLPCLSRDIRTIVTPSAFIPSLGPRRLHEGSEGAHRISDCSSAATWP